MFNKSQLQVHSGETVVIFNEKRFDLSFLIQFDSLPLFCPCSQRIGFICPRLRKAPVMIFLHHHSGLFKQLVFHLQAAGCQTKQLANALLVGPGLLEGWALKASDTSNSYPHLAWRTSISRLLVIWFPFIVNWTGKPSLGMEMKVSKHAAILTPRSGAARACGRIPPANASSSPRWHLPRPCHPTCRKAVMAVCSQPEMTFRARHTRVWIPLAKAKPAKAKQWSHLIQNSPIDLPMLKTSDSALSSQSSKKHKLSSLNDITIQRATKSLYHQHLPHISHPHLTLSDHTLPPIKPHLYWSSSSPLHPFGPSALRCLVASRSCWSNSSM